MKADDEIHLYFGILRVLARGRLAIRILAIPMAILLIAIASRVVGFTF